LRVNQRIFSTVPASFLDLEQLSFMGSSHSELNTPWNDDLVKRALEPMNISAV
jgi:hypothetical protein